MKNLPQFRRTADLTQHHLAALAKVTRARIANAETGRVELTPAEQRRIFAVLVKRIERNLAALNASAENFAEEGEGVVVP